MEFLDIGDGTAVRLDKITAIVRTTFPIMPDLKSNSTAVEKKSLYMQSRITFHTADGKEWITSDQKAIEFIEDFFRIRTFQRRS